MTTQQQQLPENSPPNEPQFSQPEVQAAFAESYGLTIGPLTFQCLQLGKQIVSMRDHIAQLEADQAQLEADQAKLRWQNSQLVTGAVAYEKRIHELEAEVEDLRGTIPTVAQVADREAAIAAKAEEARIKKAAPEDGSDILAKQD